MKDEVYDSFHSLMKLSEIPESIWDERFCTPTTIIDASWTRLLAQAAMIEQIVAENREDVLLLNLLVFNCYTLQNAILFDTINLVQEKLSYCA